MSQKLDISDIGAVIKIIDTAFERGAFRGSEASTIGSVRDRLATFFNEHEKENATSDEEVDKKE